MLQTQNIIVHTPDKHIAWCSTLCMKIIERIMTQMLETWTHHRVYLIIIEPHYRNKANYHHIW